MEKRVFFAINLPDELKTKLAGLVEELKELQPYRKIRWVPEANFHITLEFLGDQNEENIAKLDAIAREIAQQAAPFELLTDDFGCFPNERQPSVLFLGTRDTNLAQGLHKRLSDALLTKGFEVEKRRWHSHITLGRVKDRGGLCKFGTIEPPAVQFEVKSFELMESVLGSENPIYQILHSYNLCSG